MGARSVRQLRQNNAPIVCVLPAFGRNGLLPEGEHLCQWPEFALRFGGTPDNGRRRTQTLGLARMLLLLTEAGCRVAFVDGSFVTRERWPKDFDVCYEEEDMDLDLLHPILKDVSLGRAAQKRFFAGEALPANYPFDRSGRTMREAFARTREGNAKGLVRMELETVQTQMAEWLEQGEQGGTHGATGG